METITECLKSDHRRLDLLLEDITAAVERDDMTARRVRLAEYSRHLRNHLRFEEDFMFPIVERTLCSAEGSICVLRRDHREIEDRLTAMQAALYAADRFTSATARIVRTSLVTAAP